MRGAISVYDDGDSQGSAAMVRTPPNIWSDRLRGIISGQATSEEIESWVTTSWRSGQFMDTVPRELLHNLPVTGRPVARYGDAGDLRSEVCFTHPHGPGAVVVHTPSMDASNGTGTTYCIAPHVHLNAHVTVVLQGEARFFIARHGEGAAQVVRSAVCAGHVLLLPAGIAHTFGSTGGAFTVLSMQARFIEPSRPDFALNVEGFGACMAALLPDWS